MRSGKMKKFGELILIYVREKIPAVLKIIIVSCVIMNNGEGSQI